MRRTLALILIVQLMLGVVAGCAFGGMRGDTAPEITVGDWFNMAETYAANQKPEKARAYLQKIIEKYPDTTFAEKAKKKLEKL